MIRRGDKVRFRDVLRHCASRIFLASLLMRKNFRQIVREGQSTKYLTNTPQNCHDCLRKYHTGRNIKHKWVFIFYEILEQKEALVKNPKIKNKNLNIVYANIDFFNYNNIFLLLILEAQK